MLIYTEELKDFSHHSEDNRTVAERCQAVEIAVKEGKIKTPDQYIAALNYGLYYGKPEEHLDEYLHEDWTKRQSNINKTYDLNYKEFAGCLVLGFVSAFVIYSAVINLVF